MLCFWKYNTSGASNLLKTQELSDKNIYGELRRVFSKSSRKCAGKCVFEDMRILLKKQ